MALNADTMLAVLAAIEQTGIETAVGSVGADPRLADLPQWLREQIHFTVSDLAAFQGYLVTAALDMLHRYHRPARFIIGAAVFTAEPYVNNSRAYQRDDAQEVIEAGRELVERGGDQE